MKRILFFCIALLFVLQVFFCYIIANDFQPEYAKQTFVADSKNECLNLSIGNVASIANNKQILRPNAEFINLINAQVILDTQEDNVWKIVFCSVSIVLIVVAVIVLLIKANNSNKK